MPQPTPVKYFRHTDTGAPTLTGAPGAMQAVLNACLVTGYNVSAVDSVTRDGTTVTVTVSAGHGLEPGVVVLIAGADQADYNGEHRITTTTASTFEFELPESAAPASPATGTIECRQAPAGSWERAFVSGDSQRAAFRSTAVDATGFYIYIDDTNNQGTRRTGVKGYESMTDIDTGANPFPYSSADDQWYWWYKSANEASAIRWAVVADDKWFYLWWNRATDNNEGYGRLNAFGDFNSYVPADAWNCIVTGEFSVSYETYQPMLATIPFAHTPGANVSQSGVSIARDYLGVADGKMSGVAAPTVVFYNGSLTQCNPIGGCGVDFPSLITGGAIVSPVDAVEVTGGNAILRGRYPGMYSPYHDRPYSRTEPELVQGTGDLADRRFMSLPFAGGLLKMTAGTSTYSDYHRYGQALIDIIGPWR